jgi:hypothetical protein
MSLFLLAVILLTVIAPIVFVGYAVWKLMRE